MSVPGRLSPAEQDDSLVLPIRRSYERFLQADVPPGDRQLIGLHAALSAFFPLKSPNGAFSLEYMEYSLEAPRYDEIEHRRRGTSWTAVLKLVMRYYAYDVHKEPHELRDIHEQELYFGELPLLREDGTFVVGGERRRLIPRIQDLWLPEDGLPEAPRRRMMLPGEWLQYAFFAGLAPIRPYVQKAFASRHAESLMPHDMLECSSTRAKVFSLFEDPALSERLAGNVVAELNALRRVEGPVILGGRRAKKSPSGEAPSERFPLPHKLNPTWTVAEALVPFATNEKERTAGGLCIESALVPARPEAPRVRAGVEAAAARSACLDVLAPHAGTIEVVNSETLLVWPDDPTDVHPSRVVTVCPRWLPGGREGEYFHLCVSSGQKVARGDRLWESESSRGGAIALGRNARVVFARGARGAIVSEPFAASMLVRRAHSYDVVLYDTPFGPETLWPGAPGGADLDEMGIVRLGAKVAEGAALVGISSWVARPTTRRERREILERFPDGVPAADRSFRAPSAGTVVLVEMFHRSTECILPREKALLSERREPWLAVRRAAEERQGPLAEALRDEAEERLHVIERSMYLPPSVLRMIRVTVEQTRPLCPGDRLTDRRGLGAAVERIVPEGEMTALGHGNADVVFPHSKISTGTLREARLAEAALALGTEYADDLDDVAIRNERIRKGLDPEIKRSGVLYLLRQEPRAAKAKRTKTRPYPPRSWVG